MAAQYQIGDELKIWATGMTKNFRAKIVGHDTRYAGNTQQFVLEVLDTETGEPDPSWPMKLKSGDYIIRGRWEG